MALVVLPLLKLIIAERIPKEWKTDGVLDRMLSWVSQPGISEFDIKEVLNEESRNPQQQELFDRIIAFRKKMMIYRLVHFNDPVANIDVGVVMSCGMYYDSIKPDLLEDGGNINGITNSDIDCTNVGIRSASFRHNRELLEDIGTSLSCPAITTIAGNISSRYPVASPFLVKSILLSSCSILSDKNNGMFNNLIQGFGRPSFVVSCQVYA